MTQQLTLPDFDTTLAPELLIGTTEWSTDKPPMVGWYKCRVWGQRGRDHRRWWNGRNWSMRVFDDTPDADAEGHKNFKANMFPRRGEVIEWCGLNARHPDRYPYRLFMKETDHGTQEQQPVPRPRTAV